MSEPSPRRAVFSCGHFAGHLRALVREAVDGRLDVDNGEFLTYLWLQAGQVRAAASDIEDEKLGQWLVRRGVMAEDRMAVALLKLPEGVRFGAFLVNEGALAPERLESELADLSVAIMARLLGESGELTLRPGERLGPDAVTLGLTTASLLAAAMREVVDLQWITSELRPDRFVAAPGDVMLQLQSVRLTPQEGYVLSRVDGLATVGALQRMVPLPRDVFIRSLAALVVAGLVELQDAPARKAQPVATLTERARHEPTPAPPRVDDLVFSLSEQREHEETIRLAASCRQMNYYTRLGLPPTAGAEQIQTRYRALLRSYHPDRARERHLRTLQAELGEIFRCLQEAYSTLSDAERRKRYDLASSVAREFGHLPQAVDPRQDEARKTLARNDAAEAKRLLAQGDLGEAAILLEQAVRLHPEPETLLLLARVELRNPMWVQRAADRLRHALAIDPRFTEGWLELASFWGLRGQPDKQRQCLGKILEYDPENETANQALAACKKAGSRHW